MSEREQQAGVDELLDRALKAAAEGDRATAHLLAGQVLAVDRHNADAEDLLTAPVGRGEIRRLTIAFVDLVDSTALSTRIEPETYRMVVGRYRDDVLRVVHQYEGHVGSTKGDGLLVLFGHPEAHEDDVIRAVQAGLDITRDVSALSAQVRRQLGFDIAVRVGIHRGVVYLDRAQDDVYGLAANLAARVCSIAEPGTVAVSDAIEPLIRDHFELHANSPQHVKGVDDPVHSYRVDTERETTRVAFGPLVGRNSETRLSAAELAAGAGRRDDQARRGVRRRRGHRQESTRLVGRRVGRTVRRGRPAAERLAVLHRRRPAPDPQVARTTVRHQPAHPTRRSVSGL